MRLKVRVPNMGPRLYKMPTECSQEVCHGTVFKLLVDWNGLQIDNDHRVLLSIAGFSS